MCDALPGFHAFTGSDYTSAFVRKGKVRPFAFLEKDTVAQKAFAQMSSEKLNDKSVDILRPQGYMEHHKVAMVLLINTTIMFANTIPPCEAELVEHIHRASFIAKMWASADQRMIIQHPTVSDGWKIDDKGMYLSYLVQ